MADDNRMAMVTEILCDVIGDDDIVLTRETTAADAQGWDSLANVRFMLALERHFNVRFAAAEVARLANVGDLLDLIDNRV
jgi:acyl carrier protein